MVPSSTQTIPQKGHAMELDVTVLDMLPSDEEVLLYPCACTCTRSTDQTQTRPTVG